MSKKQLSTVAFRVKSSLVGDYFQPWMNTHLVL